MHILNTIHGFAFYLRRTRIAVNAKVMKISIPRNPSMNKLPTGSVSLCRDGQENKMAATMHVLAFTRRYFTWW